MKFALLKTIGILIDKVGMGLRIFLSQLQTGFLKCIMDPSPEVRDQAAENLGSLTLLNAKVDPLLMKLTASVMKADESSRNDYLTAMAKIFIVSGERITNECLTKTGEELFNNISIESRKF